MTRQLGIKTIIRIGLALLITTITACQNDNWHGWVYPDQDNLSTSIQLGSFENIEACRESAKSVIESLIEANQRIKEKDSAYEPPTADWECGYKCEYNDGFNVCERTER